MERGGKRKERKVRGVSPRRLLADEEIRVLDPEADLITLLADVPVSQRLQGGEEEGT